MYSILRQPNSPGVVWSATLLCFCRLPSDPAAIIFFLFFFLHFLLLLNDEDTSCVPTYTVPGSPIGYGRKLISCTTVWHNYGREMAGRWWRDDETAATLHFSLCCCAHHTQPCALNLLCFTLEKLINYY